MPTYNYVVVIDDADMKITHVIRGDDHISNTPKQVAVYEALGLPTPEFAHLSTILGPDRERLSKRHGATSVAAFRDMGVLPEALMNYLALLGWAPSGGDREIFSKDELIREFDLERVTPSPATFDFQKLYWINRQHIKRQSQKIAGALKDDLSYVFYLWNLPIDHNQGLQSPLKHQATVPIQKTHTEQQWQKYYEASILIPFLKKGWVNPGVLEARRFKDWVSVLFDLFYPYIDRLDQVADRAEPLFSYDARSILASRDNSEALSVSTTPAIIQEFWKRTRANQRIDAQIFKAIMDEIKLETGVKGKDLFHPVRIMLIGSHSGPDFNKLIPVIEEGSNLPLPVHVKSVRERADEFLQAFEHRQ
jgi:nondiscriminating glutamyl-tRNA synthetase